MRSTDITLITTYKAGAEMAKREYVVRGRIESVTRSEFYAAYTANLKPQYIIDILPSEYYLADVAYDGRIYHATRCSFNGSEYAIIRTYSKTHSRMELTVG